jgi:purine-binding chemotaxis protein CheW
VHSTLASPAEKIPTAKTGGLAGEYLAFQLGIIAPQDIIPAPPPLAHVNGVINLRRKVIPVVDLRLKFRLPYIDSKPK